LAAQFAPFVSADFATLTQLLDRFQEIISS
jgi:hypothetical protein